MLLFLSLIVPTENFGAGPFHRDAVLDILDQTEWHATPQIQAHENKRVVAATLAILLGPFGGHRLYMGTGPKVPILYVATLGGGFFILPLIDLGLILFTKDLSSFENSEQVFMWRKSVPTPP